MSERTGEITRKSGEVAIEVACNAEPTGVGVGSEGPLVGASRSSSEFAELNSSRWGSVVARLFPRRGESKGSYMAWITSSRILKFLVVGGLGVVVNLLVMALVFSMAGYRDWRASAIASTVAALHNYFLNNHWTFADRRRNGSALFSGAFLYLPMSAAGVAITTVSYSILTQARLRSGLGMSSSFYLFAAQLISISFGTYINYGLNKAFTWRSADDSGERRPKNHLKSSNLAAPSQAGEGGSSPREKVHVRERSMPGPRVSAELQSIQALRAVAASSVILVHIPFVGRGAFGVDIFFVISGFIICYISSLNADDFLLKRIFRIVPLYWLGTCGVFLVALLMPTLLNATTANLSNLAKSLFLIPYRREDGSVIPMLFLGWTLEYEMFFYVVFGLALAFLERWASLAASLALLAVVVAGQLLGASSTFPRFYSNPLILEFVFGMAVFAVWKRYKDSFARFPVALALAFAICFYIYLYLVESHVGRNNRIFFQGLPSVVIVLSLLALEGRIGFPKWLLLIGDASYSLYLFHPYVIQFIDKKIVSLSVLTPVSLVASVGAILACFLLAIVSFRMVERPSNEFLRRRFLKHRTRITARIAV